MNQSEYSKKQHLSLPFSDARRGFLKTAGATAISLALTPGALAHLSHLSKTIRIGCIADLHQDIMHDGPARMDAFLKKMASVKPDAIMQLGDFAYPNKKNDAVITPFNQGHRHALHVIGNHDTDNGHTKQQCLDIWGMPAPYYTHDMGSLRLIVLDCNERTENQKGYPAHINNEQLEWLKNQLSAHSGPFILASHQPLAGPAAIDNGQDFHGILKEHADKILLCINGHTHLDMVAYAGTISCFHVNSASYYWMGGNYRHESYTKEIHKKHPWISYTCPYRDPLFAIITLDPKTGTIKVQGQDSIWVGPSPRALGLTLGENLRHGHEVVPKIQPRQIKRSAL
jgi:3',5'-cyclic-AMP phosphodiesterase